MPDVIRLLNGQDERETLSTELWAVMTGFSQELGEETAQQPRLHSKCSQVMGYTRICTPQYVSLPEVDCTPSHRLFSPNLKPLHQK